MTDRRFATLDVAVDAVGRRGVITLDRPDRLNAMSPALLADLVAAAEWFDSSTDVTVVVIRGAGRAFCAGFDLQTFSDQRSAVDARATADLGRRMADAITAMRAVTIAAVHGHCVGGGLVLAASCDLRLADTSARFSIPEVDLGIPLAWGGIPRLVRELGPALTKELVLTCRPFGPEEALAARFLNRVVPEGTLGDCVEELAGSLAEKSPFVLSITKRHVNAVTEEMGSTATSFLDADVLSSAQRDPDSRAAAARYLERRSALRRTPG